MKKYIGVFLAVLLSVFFASCEGPQGPRGPVGPQGPPGQNGVADGWRVDEFTVLSNDWLLNGNAGEAGSYYYYIWEDENLTDWIFDTGLVSVYLFNQDDRGYVQRQLPVVQPRSDESGDYTEIFDYDYSYDYDKGVGTIGVYVTYSDFNTTFPPADQTFRVVKEWWNE